MAKWMVSMKKSDFDRTAAKFGIRNITARILTNRGLTSYDEIDRYLNGDASMMGDPYELEDMEKGASLMLERIKKGAKIRVIGDYDVDGICSSFILVSGLRLFGGDVDYVLPHRVKDGYGLSIKLVDDAYSDGRDTIITCDNGIAAYEQVAHAKELGMTVIVTDHHEVPFEDAEGSVIYGAEDSALSENSVSESGMSRNDGSQSEGAAQKREMLSSTDLVIDLKGREGAAQKREILPPADAVIDPKRRDGHVKFKEICGAVVAYKFLQVMAKLSENSEDNERFDDFFDEMLIFAGLATVCDVMELRDENRIIVRESLKRIANTRNKGLRALINVNNLDAAALTTYHYGFVIGPCFNATGRLELASRALALLLEEDEIKAAEEAVVLKDMNDSRKDMTAKGVEKAVELLEEEAGQSQIPKVIVVYLDDVHESIAGIIAGRIKEKYYRPTIILTESSDGGAKGSGRSIEKYDMFENLSRCKDLFTKFGGHKMAAGLSLPKENIGELRRRLNEECTLADEDFIKILHLDMVLPFVHADMELVREFEKLEPFGTGNDKPLFAQKDVALLSGRIMGKNKNTGKYKVSDGSGTICDMMYFGDLEKFNEFLYDTFGKKGVDDLYMGKSDGSMKIKIAYYPSINVYNGRSSLQLVMSDYA